MKTIHGSLAIEGKPVVAPVKEVQEVRNAIKAYEQFMNSEPYKP